MMPVIRVSDAALIDLKSIATWEGMKTPSQMVEALVREKMEALGLERDFDSTAKEPSTPNGDLEFESAPGLAFTRVLQGSIDGKDLGRTNWAKILLAMISAVQAKGFAGADLSRELQIPTRPTPFDESGYTYYPDLGISVQGQSATDVWKEVHRLAKKHRIPVEVRFQWRDNPKAQHPGQTGVLRTS